MHLSPLTVISPVDGRYSDQVNLLRDIFSEFGLFKFRLQVEICWFQKLASCDQIKELPPFNDYINDYLNSIFINFSLEDAKRIKDIECIVNHDVKAIEYFLKEKINNEPIIQKVKEFIHFACTSEDINNLAYAIMLMTTKRDILLPVWYKIISKIKSMAIDYRDLPLLSRTHGQPATPSTLGKEMANVFYRLFRQYKKLRNIKILGKINGAIGNYNAHIVAYPNINWHQISEEFVTSLGIHWNPYTTQIEPHDYLAEFFNCVALFNTILIDYVRDMWSYISLDYFTQKKIGNEIGSSTMPYKINPIDFENAEGNLGLSNAIMNHFSSKLPISRWQRDLSDSTVLRNIGVCIGYSLIAYDSLLKGTKKIVINKNKLLSELNRHWVVLSEAIQTVMRRYGISGSYELVKEITYGKYVDIHVIQSFIDSLKIPDKEKLKLKLLTPSEYIGYAVELVNNLDKYCY
ncbi:adenylosuccinate lyase [Blochmannia endosymbiont of Camponotus (Colobopsis) obliquus]|uniref:adenylosuccinate lyase n=1 Tax=Blochmannia endosymbiont of Camponotus (Colobopsis) obliquus TaxID=1505597 RepID=UPI00061A6740|nr:adenylosuccinate lyase [Blochmannia endosymbiont of Camponotus (Colobopsis) obliquus]AKC60551.1 adenylosuccinate lyase [Blochmannia endosymbiont of Camponotus (Colobopsis) obliquus]